MKTQIEVADLEKVARLLRCDNQWAVRMQGSTEFYKGRTIPEALNNATKTIAADAPPSSRAVTPTPPENLFE